MAKVIYNGLSIVPSPLVTINKNYTKTGDGTNIGVVYDIVLHGTLLPFKGSPSGTSVSPANAFWNQTGYPPDEVFGDNNTAFVHLVKKQEAIRWLFSTEGKLLEIFACDTSSCIRCNPKIISIDFEEGQWVDRVNYTITLKADWILINGLSTDKEDIFEVDLLNSVNEEWNFEEQIGQDGNVYRVSHTVSAQGILGYDETGAPFSNIGETAGGESWKHAKKWCDSRIFGSVDTDIISAILGTSGLIGGSYTKNNSLSELDGNYSIAETWILSPSVYFIEKDFSISKGNDGLYAVGYNGKIFGLSNGERTGGPQAIINAKTGIPTDSQAKIDTETALGVLLETLQVGVSPSQKSISINNNEGSVGFSFGWSADENETFRQVCEAGVNFNEGDGSYTLSLSCTIDGKGSGIIDRLANAKAAILTDAEAYSTAIDIIGDQLPSGITIGTQITSKTISINETQGSVRFGYTWKNIDDTFNNYDINIDIQFPNDVFASIPIPGRIGGPIIQDMETTTSQIVTVTLNSSNNIVKPDNATIITLIENAAEFESTWLLQSDKESYSPTTKKYTRSRSYLVD